MAIPSSVMCIVCAEDKDNYPNNWKAIHNASTGDNYTTLPVATDATYSGLQILSGLGRYARTSGLVDVLPRRVIS